MASVRKYILRGSSNAREKLDKQSCVISPRLSIMINGHILSNQAALYFWLVKPKCK